MEKKTVKKGLSERQERLVGEYRECRNKAEAYRRVMPEDAGRKDSLGQAKKANTLFTPAMMERVEELDQMEIEATKKAMEREKWQAQRKWSKLDGVEKLIELIATCDEEIERYGGRGDKLSDIIEEKRKTVEALNKMLGYNAPEEVIETGDGQIVVSFAAPDPAGEGAADPFEEFGE